MSYPVKLLTVSHLSLLTPGSWPGPVSDAVFGAYYKKSDSEEENRKKNVFNKGLTRLLNSC